MFIANLPIYKQLSRNRSIAIANYIAPLIHNTKARVLDFGSGNMFLAEHLATGFSDMEIRGVDIIKDQNFNEELIVRVPNLFFEEYPGKDLPFSDNEFDVAIASCVLHHTPNPEYYLTELKRVIKKGGCIIIIEEMYHNPLDRLYIMAEDFALNKLKKGVPVPLTFRSYKHYINEFKKQELTVLFQGYIRPSFPWKHHYVFKLVV